MLSSEVICFSFFGYVQEYCENIDPPFVYDDQKLKLISIEVQTRIIIVRPWADMWSCEGF